MLNKKKIVLISIVSAFVALFACFYLCAAVVLPGILNSKTFVRKFERLINKTTGYYVKTENLHIKSHTTLKYNIDGSKITVKKNNTDIFKIEDFEAKTGLKKLKMLNAAYLYINLDKPDKKPTKKKKSQFEFKYLPDIYAENADVILDNKLNLRASISNLSLADRNNKKYLKFYGTLTSDFLKGPLQTGKDGYFLIDKNQISAHNFEIYSKETPLILDGIIFSRKNNFDYSIKGENIPFDDFMASILYFQKSKDSSKKFIENFYDYRGFVDINLSFKNTGVFGKIAGKTLSAKTVLFNAPATFNEMVFHFIGNDAFSEAKGTLADENIIHRLRMANLFSENAETFGVIESNIQNKIDKYIPNFKTRGKSTIIVKYFVKNQKTMINYLLDIEKGGDISYKGAFLGLQNKKKRLFVHTVKDNSKNNTEGYGNLYIKKYDYSITEGDRVFNIVSGDGLFIKKDNHMIPKYLSCKTNGFAPASVTGSFGRFISGGEFSGNLKYDFISDKVFGNFIIKNFTHKDFYVQQAEINADKATIEIKSQGKYRGENFSAKLQAKNKIKDKIVIHNMDLFLDKYTTKKHSHRKPLHINSKVKDIDVTIETWKIKINKIIKDRIVLNNIAVYGSLKNGIFRFTTSEIRFAKGILNAKGLYDFKKKSSSARFSAKNVDSEIAADLIFNLPGQVEGIANGILYIKTFNKLEDIKAKVVFKIDKGYLPKLGDMEIKNKFTRRKLKLSNIVSIKDENNTRLNPADFSSDIKGKFYMDNEQLKDISIISKQKYLALLIEGNCDIKEDYADLMIFGKYNNNAQKRVKILFMPLSFVMKLIFRPENTLKNYKEKFEKIPDIETKPENTGLFRIKLKGSLKENDMNVQMKRIY